MGSLKKINNLFIKDIFHGYCLKRQSLKCPLLVSGGGVTEGQRLMSRKEVDRLRCIQAVVSKQLGQADAMRPLGLSVR